MTRLSVLRRRMRSESNPRRAEVSLRYFKTGPRGHLGSDRFLGLAAPLLHALSREYEALPLRNVSALLKSRWHEERVLALLILVRRYGRSTPDARETLHRFYMRHLPHVDNWDLVDCSAAPLVGAHLTGRRRGVLLRLAASPRLWDRRIAMIATYHDIRRGEFRWALRIARMLLGDREDLIHKAVGWMLREIGKRDRRVEEAFLRAHAARMPRTALRYAIERFPPDLRARYLQIST